MSLISISPEITQNNIYSLYCFASSLEIYEGKLWYQTANHKAQLICKDTGLALWTVSSVIAALSPRNHWEQNLIDAHNLCLAYVSGINPNTVRVKTFNQNKRKAIQLLKASHESSVSALLKGNKVTAFYRNILEPTDDTYVTIDAHAFSVWFNERIPCSKVSNISNELYTRIANDYKAVAKQVGLIPNQLQAITWLTYRNRHGLNKR